MADIIIVAIILLIIGSAVTYIIKAKKKGVKCIGCPEGAGCAHKCSGSCGNCDGGCDCHE